jgi:hypothetical protein
MDSEDCLQYHPQAFPLPFSPTQAFDAGLDGDASMFEAMDCTPWENGDGQACIPHQDWTEIQSTFYTIVDFGTICSDGLTALDDSAFPASLQESDMAATAAHEHPSGGSLSTQYPLVEDIQMTEVPHHHSQMYSLPFPTKDFANQFSTSPMRNRYPSTEDWEYYRPTITRLYRDENRTLRNVMSIMNEIYGFNAS